MSDRAYCRDSLATPLGVKIFIWILLIILMIGIILRYGELMGWD